MKGHRQHTSQKLGGMLRIFYPVISPQSALPRFKGVTYSNECKKEPPLHNRNFVAFKSEVF